MIFNSKYAQMSRNSFSASVREDLYGFHPFMKAVCDIILAFCPALILFLGEAASSSSQYQVFSSQLASLGLARHWDSYGQSSDLDRSLAIVNILSVIV